jgi:6-phosphogluconolactonase
MRGRMTVFPTVDALVYQAASRVVTTLAEAILNRGIAAIALSGGSTPRSVYELLGTDEFRTQLQWERVHLFWGDERCVPPHAPESNYRLVKESLLRGITLPARNVHRMKGEAPPGDAARAYEAEMKTVFALAQGELPEFDLLLLGLGEDGHTASLFPGSTALDEVERLVLDVPAPGRISRRITLTISVINKASRILIFVSGKNKAVILKEVCENEGQQYPVQRVRPSSGDLEWLVDQDAASLLSRAGGT